MHSIIDFILKHDFNINKANAEAYMDDSYDVIRDIIHSSKAEAVDMSGDNLRILFNNEALKCVGMMTKTSKSINIKWKSGDSYYMAIVATFNPYHAAINNRINEMLREMSEERRKAFIEKNLGSDAEWKAEILTKIESP